MVIVSSIHPGRRRAAEKDALSRLVFRDQPLDDHDVKPPAVQAAVFLVHADLAEAHRAAQAQAGGVGRKDTRQKLPVTPLRGFRDELRQERLSKTTAAGLPMDVDGELADAGIAGPVAVRRYGGPAEDAAGVFSHEDRE